MSTEEEEPAADLPLRDGRCQWCRGTDAGGDLATVISHGYWWHRDCAEDNQRELEEALG